MIQGLFTERVTVSRVEGQGEYIKGRFQGERNCEFEIPCSVQPDTGEELLNPPEGQRTREVINVFTQRELLTADFSLFKKADIVMYNGRKFEVLKVERWASLIPHFKVTCAYVLDNAAGDR